MAKNIPIHLLRDRSSKGWEIWHFKTDDIPKSEDTFGAHRDDHYIFFLLEKGTASMLVDFNKIKFKGKPCLFFVLPGQVHYRIDNAHAEGWFIAIEAALIRKSYRAVFENRFLLQEPFILSREQVEDCRYILAHLERSQHSAQPDHMLPVLRSLMDAFTGQVAGHYHGSDPVDDNMSRPVQISYGFKTLLSAQIRENKSPSDYASQLNVSESYLNEVVKAVTGFNVTYWILAEVVIEAQRLLFYTDMDVKEISGDLGYEDHSYFSRVFKKSAGVTALEFRRKYRK